MEILAGIPAEVQASIQAGDNPLNQTGLCLLSLGMKSLDIISEEVPDGEGGV